MKKIALLAVGLAAASVGAQAQSTVQLMGLVDVYAGSMKMAGDATRKSVVNSGGMTTSWWGMSGSEDLGGGMKASFMLTSFFQADSGAAGRFGEQQFSRDANVSLSSSMGTLTLGRSKAPNFLPTISFNPMGDSYTFSPLVLHSSVPLFNASGWRSTVPADTGWSNQITYSTPTFGGLKGNLHYQLGEQGTGASESAHNVGFNAFYTAGPLSLTAFWERDEINNPFPPNNPLASTHYNWMLGGSYDAGVVKAFVTSGKSYTASNSVDKKTTSLGVSAPMGAGKLLAAVAYTKDDIADKSRTTSTVGYDYTLSKRTDAYAMLMHDKITSYASGTSFGVGVRHRF
ncbi:porin [Rhodoferax sp. 4810]|nr:porin [Rhodoferax jenense]